MQQKWSGKMKRRVVYRACLIIAFMISLSGLVYFFYSYIDKQIPNIIHLIVNEKEEFDFSLPIEADLVEDDISVINIDQGKKVLDHQINIDMNKPFYLESS